MPSSAARTSGRIYKDVEIGGKKFRIGEPQKVGIVAEMEAFILSRRLDPIVFAIRACKSAPATMHAAIWQGATAAATRGLATPEEWAAFESSLWKSAFMLFKTLDPKHRDEVPDVEAAMELIEQEANLDELMSLVRFVSQDDDLKNSSGRSAGATSASKPKTDDPSTTDGPPSTITSPTDTDGRETP
jgi:hypothetical protein